MVALLAVSFRDLSNEYTYIQILWDVRSLRPPGVKNRVFGSVNLGIKLNRNWIKVQVLIKIFLTSGNLNFSGKIK
jgi:hypothetical protein